MTASDWNNILACANARRTDFGTPISWPSMAARERYYREYGTGIMAGAMAARARRMAA